MRIPLRLDLKTLEDESVVDVRWMVENWMDKDVGRVVHSQQEDSPVVVEEGRDNSHPTVREDVKDGRVPMIPKEAVPHIYYYCC
jgi:hypothetical protein